MIDKRLCELDTGGDVRIGLVRAVMVLRFIHSHQRAAIYRALATRIPDADDATHSWILDVVMSLRAAGVHRR